MSLSAGPAFFLGAAGSACAHVSHLSQYVVVLARVRLRTSHTVTHCRLVTAKVSKGTFFSPRPPRKWDTDSDSSDGSDDELDLAV